MAEVVHRRIDRRIGVDLSLEDVAPTGASLLDDAVHLDLAARALRSARLPQRLSQTSQTAPPLGASTARPASSRMRNWQFKVPLGNSELPVATWFLAELRRAARSRNRRDVHCTCENGWRSCGLLCGAATPDHRDSPPTAAQDRLPESRGPATQDTNVAASTNRSPKRSWSLFGDVFSVADPWGTRSGWNQSRADPNWNPPCVPVAVRESGHCPKIKSKSPDPFDSSRQPPVSGFSRSEVEGAGAHSKTNILIAGDPMAAPTGYTKPLGLMPRPLRPRSEAIRSTEISHAPTPQEGDAMIEILQRLDRIEASLLALVKQGQVQDWYDTKAAARFLGKSPYTVCKHCRDKRIHAEKRQCGRGRSKEWKISHGELLRIKAEGLLPARRTNRRTGDRDAG